MDTQLLVICVLTFVIHLIGTLAYAARIAGVRTRRIAISFSLFNVLILVSRTSNSFQGPFLAKRIENTIASGASHAPFDRFPVDALVCNVGDNRRRYAHPHLPALL